MLLPEHLSSYALTIEEKTVLGQWQRKGTFQAMDEESAAIQFERLMELTQTAGYEHYEISNFCRPGFYSQHNSNYWRQQNYLGIGPSAHSYDGTSRQFNVSNNSLYVKSIEQGKVPFEREILTRENKVNEYLFTTLRTTWGVDLEKLKSAFGVDLVPDNQAYLIELKTRNLIVMDDNILKLTMAGKLIADKIASDLFVMEKADS